MRPSASVKDSLEPPVQISRQYSLQTEHEKRISLMTNYLLARCSVQKVNLQAWEIHEEKNAMPQRMSLHKQYSKTLSLKEFSAALLSSLTILKKGPEQRGVRGIVNMREIDGVNPIGDQGGSIAGVELVEDKSLDRVDFITLTDIIDNRINAIRSIASWLKNDEDAEQVVFLIKSPSAYHKCYFEVDNKEISAALRALLINVKLSLKIRFSGGFEDIDQSLLDKYKYTGDFEKITIIANYSENKATMSTRDRGRHHPPSKYGQYLQIVNSQQSSGPGDGKAMAVAKKKPKKSVESKKACSTASQKKGESGSRKQLADKLEEDDEKQDSVACKFVRVEPVSIARCQFFPKENGCVEEYPRGTVQVTRVSVRRRSTSPRAKKAITFQRKVMDQITKYCEAQSIVIKQSEKNKVFEALLSIKEDYPGVKKIDNELCEMLPKALSHYHSSCWFFCCRTSLQLNAKYICNNLDLFMPDSGVACR